MLRELFEWLLSRGTGPGRRLGLDREAVSIAARHRRQSEAWEPHLAATRQCLLDAAAACPQGGTALVLGSGACLDVPLSALAARFDTVVLADAHHPRPARRLARAFPNVRLMPVDLTGLAGPVGQVARHGGTLPRPLPIPDLSLGLRPDLTVSVNLASQLPIPLLRLLGSRLDETAQTDFGRAVIEAHFAALARLPGRVCLVCDTAWERLEDGRVTAATDALYGAPHPAADRTWFWDVAPRPEESFSFDRRNRVAAWLDYQAAFSGKTTAATGCLRRPGPAARLADLLPPDPAHEKKGP